MTHRTRSRPAACAAALLVALAACDSPTKPDPEPRDPIGSVTLPTAAADLAVGRTVQLTADVRDTLGLSYTATVAWSSSSEAVATVDASGLVRGVGPGTATITAKAGTKEGQATVYVIRPYQVVYLGSFGGESRATAINELGHVVGSAGSRSWLWKDGALTELFVPGAPRDINDRGQVVGDGAYLFDDGQLTELYPSRRATATAINEKGEVAGSWISGEGRRLVHGGWVWREGVATDLPAGAQPHGINEDGTVAGRSYLGPEGYYWEQQEAFLWKEGATTTLAGGHAGAFALNDAGEAAGFTRGEFGWQVSLWLSAGQLRVARPPFGHIARGINNHDHVVGAVCGDIYFADPSWDKNAFLWKDGRLIDLNAMMAESDWILDSAADINDRGQIVGWGHHRTTNQVGALLLDPPAP